MALEIKIGSIIDAPEQYIAHQCNCVSSSAQGVAKQIFDTFTWSNIYATRHERGGRDFPGIIVKGNGKKERYVINMMAQLYPGRPNPKIAGDTEEMRKSYFQVCLDKIAGLANLESIAIPYGIGCGLAGGNWDEYFKMIKDWSDKENIKVSLWKLNS